MKRAIIINRNAATTPRLLRHLLILLALQVSAGKSFSQCTQAVMATYIAPGTVWNTPQTISGLQVVSAGVTLTISSTTISFNPGSGITVEPGGRLEITSSVLNPVSLNDWLGLTAQGNASLSQNALNQGWISIAGTTITGACIALQAENGGVIQATDCYIDNFQSCAILMQNYLSPSLDDDIGYFKRCQVYRTINSPSNGCIQLKGVYGIKLTACTLENRIGTFGPYGLNAVNATFYMEADDPCITSLNTGCTVCQGSKNYFVKFDKAISLSNASPGPNFPAINNERIIISNVVFENNIHSIYNVQLFSTSKYKLITQYCEFTSYNYGFPESDVAHIESNFDLVVNNNKFSTGNPWVVNVWVYNPLHDGVNYNIINNDFANGIKDPSSISNAIIMEEHQAVASLNIQCNNFRMPYTYDMELEFDHVSQLSHSAGSSEDNIFNTASDFNIWSANSLNYHFYGGGNPLFNPVHVNASVTTTANATSSTCTYSCIETAPGGDDHLPRGPLGPASASRNIEPDEVHLMIVPNPSSSVFTITGSGQARLESISIVDSKGAHVKSFKNVNPGTNLDIRDLPGGIYMVMVETASDSKTLRLLILK
jgi:hypothetical protein